MSNISTDEMKIEKKKLKEVVSEIDSQLSTAGSEIMKDSDNLKEFQRMVWANQQEMDSGEMYNFVYENELQNIMLDDKAKQYRRLYKVKDNPYFGSIIFNGEPIYIGISSVKKDLDYLVCDWRAPICSMFYDFELGHAFYKTPEGKEEGEITRKRQYKIENREINQVFDTNINIDDDMLQDVLAQTSSDKMKNIVNTIQAEQNAVIRDDKTDNIIVQGIAGSGKTSVALHRVAFLLYRLEYLTSGNVLIFSPNNVFTEYISDVLPDLGEANTLQTTIAEFAKAYTPEYYHVESYSSFVERFYKGKRQDNELIRFKLSDDIIPAIEHFCKYFTKCARFVSSITHKEKEISIDELNDLLFVRYENKPLMERMDLIAEKINNAYFKGYASDLISIKSKLFKAANFKKDYKSIYKCFFDTAIFHDAYKFDYRKNENVRGISEHVIRYEDSTIFMYMKFLLEGFPYNVAMREVVIDEAQDYTYLQYKILKKIFKNAHFTILGDVNQTVNPFYRYEKLDILLKIFKDNSKYIELKKTYRSSPEIIEYANSVLGLKHVSAIRRKEDVPVIKRDIKDLKHIGKDVKYLKSKYKSIAIITKSIDEANVIADAIRPHYSKVSVIDINTSKFNKQLVVAPAYGVKGLEFDSAIIINNFSDDKYLYYVAVTRCQHELIIYE